MLISPLEAMAEETFAGECNSNHSQTLRSLIYGP